MRLARERADVKARIDTLEREKAAAQAIAAAERAQLRRLEDARELLAARLESLLNDIPLDSTSLLSTTPPVSEAVSNAVEPGQKLLAGLDVSGVTVTHASVELPSSPARHTGKIHASISVQRDLRQCCTLQQ
jgi:hypothetical protein